MEKESSMKEEQNNGKNYYNSPRHKRRTCLRLLKKKPQNAPLDL